MKIKPGLVPPGGYIFRDSDGVVHRGQNWPHLVRVVAQYRAHARKPPGNPAQEITSAVCAVHPQLCHVKGPSALGSDDKEAYYLRVMSWLTRAAERFRMKTIKYVTPLEAQERADICRRCQFQDVWMKDCPSCQKSADKISAQLTKDRPQVGRGLMGCAVLSENTEVSVHLVEDQVTDSRLPAHCWKKRTK